MKKYAILFLIVIGTFFAAGTSSKNKLLVLNWGEYINEEAVSLFEEEYNCEVLIDIADSNELFYAKIKSGTTAYDLVVPSDYMIERMHEKDLLQPIQKELLSNYDLVENPFMPGVLGIQSLMFDGNEDYAVPYFWGTFGLMYNKEKAGLEDAITTLGWEAYFNPDKLPSGTKVGMYDVPRFAYAAALLYQNQSPNLETDEALELAKTTLESRSYDVWGTDTLKRRVAAKNLDLAFVYTGDFLDMLYTKLDENPDMDAITFDIHIPEQTIAFLDAFVMPKKARHVELAHQFIDFFLRPEIAYLNASVVGYCTPLVKAYEEIVGYDGDDPWESAWAYATNTYYPLPLPSDPVQFKGTPLANLNRSFLSKIDTMVNNVKVKG